MHVFEGEVPRFMTINYQTRYGVMHLERVREDGVAELHSLQTEAMMLYAPINTLSNPIVSLHEGRIVICYLIVRRSHSGRETGS